MTISKNRSINGKDIFIFILSLLWFIEIQLIGIIFLSELLYLVTCFLVIAAKYESIRRSPFLSTVFKLSLLWLAATILTDFYIGNSYYNIAKGSAKIFFMIVNTFAIYVLVENDYRRILIWISGFAFGAILKTIWFPYMQFAVFGAVWKFGYGYPMTILLIIASRLCGINLTMMLIGLFIINLLFDCRELSMLCAVAAIINLLNNKIHGPKSSMLSNNLILQSLFGILLIIVLIVSFKFLYGVSDNFYTIIDVGQRRDLDAEERNILYGRLPVFVGAMAVIDSPIIGRGSYNEDEGYLLLVKDWSDDVGIPFRMDNPTNHSYIIGSWVESGIFGAIFWLYILFSAVKALKLTIIFNIPSVPINIFFLFKLCWDILFSPFAGEARLTVAIALIILNFIFTSANDLTHNKRPLAGSNYLR